MQALKALAVLGLVLVLMWLAGLIYCLVTGHYIVAILLLIVGAYELDELRQR